MNPTQRYAINYWNAGLCVLPLLLDGSRNVALPTWKQYQVDRPTLEQITNWFASPAGIAIVTGMVSGGAEAIDFDDASTFAPVFDALPTDLHNRLSIYETPKGFHMVYRCVGVCGRRIIAKRPDGSIRIETRGEGCLTTAEGSPFNVHPKGTPYCHYMGRRLEDLGTITPDERKHLWRLCAKQDQSGEPTPSQKLGYGIAQKEFRERHPLDAATTGQARAYLEKMEPAVQGSNGSKACFRAACKLLSFGLTSQDALRLLIDVYNPRCNPPWTERELEHKVEDAMRRVGR